MPNYVYSAFSATGPEEEVARFKSMMIKANPNAVSLSSNKDDLPDLILDFRAILPMPKDWKDGNEEEWGIEAWGTKWCGFDVNEKTQNDGSLWFQFTTAWDFPTAAFEAIATEFPSLVFNGSAFEENHEFELVGEFNGDDDWGPGKIEWITI